MARASLEELLEDYRDFLRTRRHPLWEKDSCEASFVRKLGARPDVSCESYRTCLDTRPPEIVANILICLIHQTNYLLDQQLRSLEKAFLAEGGLRERMTRARLESPPQTATRRVMNHACTEEQLVEQPALRTSLVARDRGLDPDTVEFSTVKVKKAPLTERRSMTARKIGEVTR